MEYRSAIVDELGCLVAWCSELSNEETERILNEHPEYSFSCLKCDSDGYNYYDEFDSVEYYDEPF